MKTSDYFIAVDPGREKTGIAILTMSGGAVWHGIINSDYLVDEIKNIAAEYDTDLLVIGSGTSSKAKQQLLQKSLPFLNIVVVDEYRTTDEARKLYFAANPPQGMKKLIPLGMQTPPVPVDDYAAIAIGRRYLKQNNIITG